MLDKVPLFSDLDEAEFESLSRKAIARQFPRNTIIINEGDETDSMYFILSGRVRVFASDEKGKEVILNVQGPGEYFGELSLIDSEPRSASVMTVEKTKLSVLSKRDFYDFLDHHPQAVFKILRSTVKMLRELTDNVKSLALMDVYGRVARVLLQLAREEGNELVIKDELTQQDIANRVGASREMVSRILKDLKTGGYISVDRKHITIKERLPHDW